MDAKNLDIQNNQKTKQEKEIAKAEFSSAKSGKLFLSYGDLLLARKARVIPIVILSANGR